MLKLSSINQNPASRVSFEIILTEQKQEQGQKWQYYEVKLEKGTEVYHFKSQNKEAISNIGTVAQIGKFAFVLEPYNELEAFTKSLEKFFQSKQQSFRFEPSDPSFELLIEKLPKINGKQHYKVYFWLDAGNTQALECTWDGLGVRFICESLDFS